MGANLVGHEQTRTARRSRPDCERGWSTSLPIDHSAVVIAALLEERVLSGQLSPGDRLLSERQLALDPIVVEEGEERALGHILKGMEQLVVDGRPPTVLRL